MNLEKSSSVGNGSLAGTNGAVEFNFPPGGIPSLHLPVVVVLSSGFYYYSCFVDALSTLKNLLDRDFLISHPKPTNRSVLKQLGKLRSENSIENS